MRPERDGSQMAEASTFPRTTVPAHERYDGLRFAFLCSERDVNRPAAKARALQLSPYARMCARLPPACLANIVARFAAGRTSDACLIMSSHARRFVAPPR